MGAEVIGIDHIYLSVRSLDVSEKFYDAAFLAPLGFRKNKFTLADAPHVQYFNRHFGFVLRPATSSAAHDPGAAGLHHFCLRVDSAAEIDAVAAALAAAGIETSAPRLYPEYAADYYATFFTDPDGIRLEVTNFRAERRQRMEEWA